MGCDLEGQDTHVLVDVEFARPVEVEDGVEGPWVAIKEVLVLNEIVVCHKIHDLLMGLHSSQISQSVNINDDIMINKSVLLPGVWKLLEKFPRDFMPHAANIESNSLVTPEQEGINLGELLIPDQCL